MINEPKNKFGVVKTMILLAFISIYSIDLTTDLKIPIPEYAYIILSIILGIYILYKSDITIGSDKKTED